MKGKLIIIEGLDGSGKSTQMQLLCQRAEQLGKPVRRVKFPNYDEDSSALVKAYLSGELGSLQQINAYAASVLYSVDRYATWRRHMHSDYEQGAVFLLDRYTTANMYHQTTKLPHEEWDSFLDWLVDLEFQKMGLPAPDLVLYLDMRPQTARRLMEKRYHGDESKKDLHEKDTAYLARSRAAAEFCARHLGWDTVHCTSGDAMRSIEEIQQEVQQLARKTLG